MNVHTIKTCNALLAVKVGGCSAMLIKVPQAYQCIPCMTNDQSKDLPTSYISLTHTKFCDIIPINPNCDLC